jgi:hypothetical protein
MQTCNLSGRFKEGRLLSGPSPRVQLTSDAPFKHLSGVRLDGRSTTVVWHTMEESVVESFAGKPFCIHATEAKAPYNNTQVKSLKIWVHVRAPDGGEKIVEIPVNRPVPLGLTSIDDLPAVTALDEQTRRDMAALGWTSALPPPQAAGQAASRTVLPARAPVHVPTQVATQQVPTQPAREAHTDVPAHALKQDFPIGSTGILLSVKERAGGRVFARFVGASLFVDRSERVALGGKTSFSPDTGIIEMELNSKYLEYCSREFAELKNRLRISPVAVAGLPNAMKGLSHLVFPAAKLQAFAAYVLAHLRDKSARRSTLHDSDDDDDDPVFASLEQRHREIEGMFVCPHAVDTALFFHFRSGISDIWGSNRHSAFFVAKYRSPAKNGTLAHSATQKHSKAKAETTRVSSSGKKKHGSKGFTHAASDDEDEDRDVLVGAAAAGGGDVASTVPGLTMALASHDVEPLGPFVNQAALIEQLEFEAAKTKSHTVVLLLVRGEGATTSAYFAGYVPKETNAYSEALQLVSKTHGCDQDVALYASQFARV